MKGERIQRQTCKGRGYRVRHARGEDTESDMKGEDTESDIKGERVVRYARVRRHRVRHARVRGHSQTYKVERLLSQRIHSHKERERIQSQTG